MAGQFMPVVQPEIFDLRPDYCALSIVARGIANDSGHAASERPAGTVLVPTPWPAWGDAHLESWRTAYRLFRAKPQRTPSSAEALISRVRSAGHLPSINPVVDLYNSLSVQFAIPIGGENLATYAGAPILKRATGRETFDTTKEGVPIVEPVPAGEVVWADDLGVTCRRWNWRQGRRTRIDEATTNMWFVLERLEPMPVEELLKAGERLVEGLRSLSTGASINTALINRGGLAKLSQPAHAGVTT